ncbi:ATP-binding protein, partial [archaeon]
GGYVAADLYAVIREMRDLVSPHSYHSFEAMSEAFSLAMRKVPPSCLRGVSVTSHSKISFEDVIGCSEAKQVLAKVFAAYQPALRERLKRFNLLTPLGGVLLYGPPGNSKTRLVAAAAHSFRLPLIALTSADIYSAYLGDAEAEVRKAFGLARQAAPCILFFDEMDSLVANRDDSQSSSAHNVEARVLATFLNEMDGINTHAGNAGVIVMGATNRVDCIDPALLRKGRFYQSVYVAPPSQEERQQLVWYFMQRNHVDSDRVEEIVSKCWEGMSGAEVENLCKEAALQQINMVLTPEHT